MGRGRPSRLTPELQLEMVNYIAAGNYPEVAAQACGVHKSLYYDWMKKGAENKSPRYRDFHEAVRKAKAECEARHVLIIERAAEKTWQAAAWYLERTCPERWGLKRNIEVVDRDKEEALPVEEMTEEQLMRIVSGRK